MTAKETIAAARILAEVFYINSAEASKWPHRNWTWKKTINWYGTHWYWKSFRSIAGLIFKLIQLNTPIYLIKIIHSFTTGRRFYVKVGKSKSRSHNIQFGVPQGAVLSPTLYNVFTHDIPQLTNCKVSLFADDTAFFKSSRFVKDIEKNLQYAVNKYKSYFKRWKIQLNLPKTQAIFFTKRRSKQIPTGSLRLGSENVEWTYTAKYLGLVLDKSMTLKQHTDYAANKSSELLTA